MIAFKNTLQQLKFVPFSIERPETVNITDFLDFTSIVAHFSAGLFSKINISRRCKIST